MLEIRYEVYFTYPDRDILFELALVDTVSCREDVLPGDEATRAQIPFTVLLHADINIPGILMWQRLLSAINLSSICHPAVTTLYSSSRTLCLQDFSVSPSPLLGLLGL